MGYDQQFIQPTGAFSGMDIINKGLLESKFGTIKPHVLSCANPEIMLGVVDPMIYSVFDLEGMQL
jgi:hypothetical protein